MRINSHLNVLRHLDEIPMAQHGYFTSAQAAKKGIKNYELARAVSYGHIHRLDYGVYRVAGAGVDPHQELRVAWLRLAPALTPRQRTRKPSLWVSHESAASVLGLGVFSAELPEFISTRRIQTRVKVRVRVRRRGLNHHEWLVRDGFAVTSPARTLADLAQANHDGGHLGRFAADAIATGLATRDELQIVLGRHHDLGVLLELADKSGEP
ncbi:type IV toxin-antitoxin system AbiEi family antitoxin domain-containing protein [Candidatus Poriferisocius sp.]|uniref:type IV toxin-antitoxin system AbiEi family antitoxin domain-containing protein n=1 Tax=Candidatus Poriferisocius sp. TaxID=3101276 RepID=UPI003B0295CD